MFYSRINAYDRTKSILLCNSGGYEVKGLQSKSWLCLVAYTYNPSPWQLEVEGLNFEASGFKGNNL
jgi:hypothetical protein